MKIELPNSYAVRLGCPTSYIVVKPHEVERVEVHASFNPRTITKLYAEWLHLATHASCFARGATCIVQILEL